MVFYQDCLAYFGEGRRGCIIIFVEHELELVLLIPLVEGQSSLPHRRKLFYQFGLRFQLLLELGTFFFGLADFLLNL